MEDSLQTDPISRRTLLRHIAAVSASAVFRPDSFIPRVEQFPDYLGVLGGAAPEQFSFSGGECYFNGQGPRKYAVAMFDANLLVPELLGTPTPDKDAARELMGTTSAQLVFNMGFFNQGGDESVQGTVWAVGMGEIHHQHWQAALVVFNDRSLYMGYTTSEALNQQREAILAIVNPGLVLWKKGVEIKDMNFESLIPVLNAVKNPQEAGRHAQLFFYNRDITGPRGTSIIASFPDGRLGVFQTRGVEPHTLLSAAIMAGADSIGSFDGGGSTFMAVKTKDGDVHLGPPTTENRPMRAFGVVKSPA